MALTLPPLPYAYDALAPYMSKETLEFHHDKHHNAYVTAGTPMVADGTKYAGKSLEEICKMAKAATTSRSSTRSASTIITRTSGTG